jgi:hypothetical protein
MYDPWSLSTNLKPGWLEIVVEAYDAGKMKRLHDTLVKQSHLNQSQFVPLLRTLVCRFDSFWFDKIVEGHLNGRARRPFVGPLVVHISYPEPGVHRTWVGTDVLAWIDQVALPESFRKGS